MFAGKYWCICGAVIYFQTLSHLTLDFSSKHANFIMCMQCDTTRLLLSFRLMLLLYVVVFVNVVVVAVVIVLVLLLKSVCSQINEVLLFFRRGRRVQPTEYPQEPRPLGDKKERVPLSTKSHQNPKDSFPKPQ